ncbi:hypothetical protein BH10BAC2_BH10BAC2_22280 [soil metagenome]
MYATIIILTLLLLALYLFAGIVFTIAFQLKGLPKIDEGVHGSSWGFRMIIIPGCIVFWPALWSKWRKSINSKQRNVCKVKEGHEPD